MVRDMRGGERFAASVKLEPTNGSPVMNSVFHVHNSIQHGRPGPCPLMIAVSSTNSTKTDT